MATMTHMPIILNRALRRKYNIKMLSQPAMGKTYLLHWIVNEMRKINPAFYFDVWDGGTMAPTDAVMSVPDMEAMVMRKIRDSGLPTRRDMPDAVGIIYVGEMALMGLETSRGFQKLWNHEDYAGEGSGVPPGIIFVGDGNRLNDKSGAKQESRANGSRYLTIMLEYDVDYALGVMRTYHDRVAAFAIRNPQCIDNYDEVFNNSKLTENDLLVQEGKHGIWGNLRSWHRVSEMMHDKDDTGIDLLPEELSRSVGSGLAATFTAFCQMLDSLSTLEDVVRDPEKTPVARHIAEQYALSTMLSLLVKQDNFVPISIYVQRYAHEIQIVFLQLMNQRLLKPEVKGSALETGIHSKTEYKKWITAPHIARLMGATV